MRVLLALTYYRPHLSGLTIYVERLAQGLVARGHEVTVLASQHEPELPRESVVDGVRVVRAPVTARRGKGVLMASHGRLAGRLLAQSDVLSIHVPQLEAGSLALRARRRRVPAVLTYHCDLLLPAGAANRVAERAVAASNALAAALSTRIVAYTADYAGSVAVLRRHRDKIEVIPPPVVMPEPTAAAVEQFRRRHGLVLPDGRPRPTLGMAARLATEKGVEVLLDAFPTVRQRHPELQVLFAGPYEAVPGEDAYRARLAPDIERLGERWRFLGPLEPDEMPAFLGALDCLVVPSVNSTESFGLVQVEAMLCGTPVVASGLPGVREVVRRTGMGEVTPPRDAAALAGAIGRILEQPERYTRTRQEVEATYDLDVTIDRYEALFGELVGPGRM